MKEEALDRIMWRACFGRGFGPVVRQTTKWMNVWIWRHVTRKMFHFPSFTYIASCFKNSSFVAVLENVKRSVGKLSIYFVSMTPCLGFHFSVNELGTHYGAVMSP
jgi:hypothetical protein